MSSPDFVYINTKKVPIQDWSFTIFQLCDSLGIKIPRFCYHERLSIAGNCRMCMVEVASSIKPVISCATSLSKGMSILTNSVLAKRARENVLEFLLINHPLDCPICDQGGECDLQDQSIAYGSDKGRFVEVKRSVEDKQFGPIVKTVMTRCIHCTRCVRFFEEIAGVPSLGTMGRGKDTEISTYLSVSLLNSNISGNVVDLCPVGALTSKPQAFLYRPWELTSVETVDTTDSLCSNIRVDLKGAELVRILPKRNDLINEDWISDSTRYGYEGLKQNRLSVPMLRDSATGEFMPIGWSSFYSAFVEYYRSQLVTSSASSSVIHLGSNLDLFSVYLSSFFSKFLNNVQFFSATSTTNENFILRHNYISPEAFNSIDASDVCVISSLNLSTSLPVLQARLKKNNNSLLHCGLDGSISLDSFHIGLDNSTVVSLYRGKNIFSTFFSTANKVSILTSLCDIPAYSSITSLRKINVFPMLPTITDIHTHEVGYTTTSQLKHISSSTLYYAIDTDTVLPDSMFNTSTFLIYQGTNAQPEKNKLVHNFVNSWYIPTTSSFEFRGFFLNILGYLQLTRKCTTKLGLSLSNSDILINIFMNLSKAHPLYNGSTIRPISATYFYASLLDFIVVSLADATFVSLAGSSFSKQFLSFSAYVSGSLRAPVNLTSTSYIKYSSTLSTVSSLRKYTTF